jgi:hypothetical protein
MKPQSSQLTKADHTTQCHNKYKYTVLSKTKISYGHKHVYFFKSNTAFQKLELFSLLGERWGTGTSFSLVR